MTDIEILESLKSYTCKPEVVDKAIKALEQELKFETVCRALVSIADKEGSDYGYTEACDIADMYLEQIKGELNGRHRISN